MLIVFVYLQFVKNVGCPCHDNQSGLLKIEILILLRFQNLGTPPDHLMIYHSTITWLTLTRSLDGSDGQIKILTLYSEPNHNNNPSPNEKFELLPCMFMSRDHSSFLPII